MSGLLSSAALQRALKALLVGCVALYFGLVALGNITAYGVNYAFVQHVLGMDTTFKDNPLMWRAIDNPLAWRVAYAGIIAFECVAFLFLAYATVRYAGTVRAPEREVDARRLASNALVFGMLLWFGGFMTVGGEWFQMWQSSQWNGMEPAFRNFACQGLILLYVNLTAD